MCARYCSTLDFAWGGIPACINMLRKVSDLHIGGGEGCMYILYIVFVQIDCCIWGMGASKIAHFLSLN